jgi:hypothetical protein
MRLPAILQDALNPASRCLGHVPSTRESPWLSTLLGPLEASSEEPRRGFGSSGDTEVVDAERPL